VLLCYVLHHAQDARLVLDEASRALRQGGLAVVYEDIPRDKLDRAICWFHNRQWQRKTGPCTFLTEQCWRESFVDAGFQVVSERSLSRWRNFAHPVSRRLFVLKSMDVERASHRRRQSVSGTVMISEETYARV
jgi:hypothetical protein